MKNGKNVFIKSDKLQKLVQTISVKAGLSQENADVLADILIETSLRGVDSHGLRLLGDYIYALTNNIVNRSPKFKCERKGSSSLIVDGDNALGLLVGFYAVDKAIPIARREGMVVVACKNANHCGALSSITLSLAKNGLFGLAVTNSTPAMVAWGGNKSVIGTNPISVGIPTNTDPIVLDMATSKVALGKLLVMKEKGLDKLPKGWALGPDGNETTNLDKAIKARKLLPVGGPKGFGLAITIEVLAGILTGSSILTEIKDLSEGKPQNLGLFIFTIDPTLFLSDKETYLNRINTMKNIIKSSGKSVFFPGELEMLEYKRRSSEGIHLGIPEINSLQKAVQLTNMSQSILTNILGKNLM